MLKRFFLLFFLLIFPFILTGAQDETMIGPETYPEGINPLTGLPVDDPDLLERRPMHVKISNFPAVVRPQTGLNAADIVWEHLLAGGVTRFTAIFHGQDVEKVGPVRSARLVDMELIRIYRGLFSYSGMAQGAIEIMNRDALVSSRAIGGGDCPAMCRFPEEGVALEHTMYANTPALHELAAERDRSTEPEPISGMAFDETPPEGGTPAEGVITHYRQSSSSWEYDTEGNEWLRLQDGEPHFDAATDSRVSAANVVIFEDQHIVQPFVRDQYWGPPNFAYYVNFVGEGRIFLFRDGRYYEGIWRRDSQDDVLTYYDLDGNVLPFKPGNTFFSLVPEWVDGYQLTFLLDDAPTATVIGEAGASLHTGPGEAYASPDVTYAGDTFQLAGRNKDGDWLRVAGLDETPLWLPLSRLDVGDYDVMQLPNVRPIIEG